VRQGVFGSASTRPNRSSGAEDVELALRLLSLMESYGQIDATDHRIPFARRRPGLS